MQELIELAKDYGIEVGKASSVNKNLEVNPTRGWYFPFSEYLRDKLVTKILLNE